MTLESGDRGLCLVLVAGLTLVKTQHADFPNLGRRVSPFERTPPQSVYAPPQGKVEMVADSSLGLTVCDTPGESHFPTRLTQPEDVGVEHRGKGHNQRRVHNILPDGAGAGRLLVVEVYTDEGTTSSWLSHEHDVAQPGEEAQLEETYCHRPDPPQGFAFQWVYTDDRSLNACMAPYNRNVVMVPCGYHPVVTIVGYDSYYLSVMAGSDRRWLFTWEDNRAWISIPKYPRHDWRTMQKWIQRAGQRC